MGGRAARSLDTAEAQDIGWRLSPFLDVWLGTYVLVLQKCGLIRVCIHDLTKFLRENHVHLMLVLRDRIGVWHLTLLKF